MTLSFPEAELLALIAQPRRPVFPPSATCAAAQYAQ
jgi:hypothetical protein